MEWYYEDGINARTNSVTTLGYGCLSYPAVIGTPTFSDEETTEPVDLDTAKTWCAVDGTDFDSTIELLITTAREQCEAYANLSFIPRTVTATVRAGTKLPYGKVVEIQSITKENGSDVDADYKDLTNGIYEVTYTAAPPDPLPSKYKTAVLNQVAYLFQHRGDENEGQLSPGTKAILKPLRVV